MWAGIIKLLLPLLLELIGQLGERDECPDGVCPPELEAEVSALNSVVNGPGAQSLGDFFKCLDYKAFFEAVTALVAVIKAAMSGCPPIDDPVKTQDGESSTLAE